jgi:hypothetical protein
MKGKKSKHVQGSFPGDNGPGVATPPASPSKGGKTKKRKRDNMDEGNKDTTVRLKKSEKPKSAAAALELATKTTEVLDKEQMVAMEVDNNPQDDGVKVSFSAVVRPKYPTMGWTLNTPKVPMFYDDWYRPFANKVKELEKEGLTRDEANEAMGKLMTGRSTRMVLAALWGPDDKSKLNHMIEAATLVLGYTPEFVALGAVNTWHIVVAKSAEGADKLIRQQVVWKEGTADMVIFRKMTLSNHKERILMVINIPDEIHFPWIMQLLKRPWEGKYYSHFIKTSY